MPTLYSGLYILPLLFYFFSPFSKAISVSTAVDRFSRSFHQMEGICVNFSWSGLFFFTIPQWTLPWQPILCQITYPPLHLLLCLSETEWDIPLQICVLIAPLIALHRVKRWWKSVQYIFWVKEGEKWKLCCDSAEIGLYRRISQQLQNQSLPMFQRW